MMFQIFLALLLNLRVPVPIDSKSIADPFTYMLSGDTIHWPTNTLRNIYTKSGRYIPRNIIPTRFQTYGLFAYLAFPRLRPGVPITLGRIPLLTNRGMPEIQAYPNWDIQDEDSPDALQNVVDLFLDEKKILWVLDSGEVNTLGVPEQKGHPRVFGINIFTKKVVYNVDLSRYSPPCRCFQYVVAENRIGRPFLYISCSQTCSLVVIDVKNDKGSVIALPNPCGPSDILYMVILRPAGKQPSLVFSHLSYPVLYGVNISDLRKGHLGQLKSLGEKTGEMVILGTDNGSKVYFRWKGSNQVRVWDLANISKERGVLAGESSDLRASTHISGGSRLLTWTLESNFKDFVQGNVGCIGASACLKPLVKKS